MISFKYSRVRSGDFGETITYLLKFHSDYECPVVGAMTQTSIFDEEISCPLLDEKAELKRNLLAFKL